MKTYKVKQLIEPCDMCNGDKYIQDRSKVFYWTQFHIKFAKLYENQMHTPTREQLEKLREEMPSRLFLSCGQCNGEGKYETEIDFREALFELMTNEDFCAGVEDYKGEHAEDTYDLT